MRYKYQPLYKYIALAAIYYFFFKYQNIMSFNLLIINTILLTLFILIIDLVSFDTYPPLLNLTEHMELKNDEPDGDMIDDILDNIE